MVRILFVKVMLFMRLWENMLELGRPQMTL